MPPWLRPTLSFFLFLWAVVVGYHPLGVRAATTVVQSTDPAIEYVGVWERLKLNSTTAYAVSNTTGSKAVYTFAGTRISVFGVVLPRDSPGSAQVSEYSVDGGAPTRYTAPGNVVGATYDVPFFSAPSLSSQGQHTLTILNLGDEFIIGHFEVTTNPSRIGPSESESDPGPSFITTTSSGSSATSTLSSNSNSTLVHLQSTTQSTSTQSTSAGNGTLTSTNTTALSSTLAPTVLTSITSPTSILPTSTSSHSTPNSGLAQGRTTALSKGATIGGGIAGTLGFLFLVGGLCWYGQRRGRRKSEQRHASSASNDPKAPLGIHNVTSQVTVGSDPFAADPAARLRRGPPLYIPVASASDLSTRNTQYTPTPTQGPSRAGYGYGYGYENEKYGYGMDDVPLQSPISPVSASASNLLDTPARHTFVSQSTQPDTPVEVRRIDSDGRRREADGGVRIAGGRPGQRVDDTDDSFLDLAERKSIGSTLPPAYDFDE